MEFVFWVDEFVLFVFFIYKDFIDWYNDWEVVFIVVE